MKLPMPNMELAKQAAEAYRRDGVRAELGYDDQTGQWYADLHEKDYEIYENRLRSNHGEVLETFGKPWKDAKNIQSFATAPPPENAETLFLYLVDNTCGTAKGFKATASLDAILKRKNAFAQYGSHCEKCGHQVSVVLIWQNQRIK